MESAPLNRAHVHARNASLETTKANVAAASEEHELAAGEFANAAKETGDREALRILALLEHQHRTLSRIIKSPTQGTHAANAPATTPHHAPQSPEQQPASSSTASPTKTHPPAQPSQQRPSTPAAQRNPHRELTSSIATNLATARGRPPTQQRRGLPASPELTRDNAGGKMVPTPERQSSPGSKHRRQRTQGSTDEQRSVASGEKRSDSPPTDPPPADEPFNRFYNTFENLFHRLSAPLAFAGLPLNPTIAGQTAQEAPDPTKPAAQRPRPPHQPPPASDPQPDLSTIFSRAALRALKDDHPALNPAESFYVVPPSGGTLSYASMLAREREREREHRDLDRHIPSTISEGSDEFVDASENPAAADSPRASRRRPLSRESSSGLAGSRAPKGGTRDERVLLRAGTGLHGGGKTREELELENEALRALTDQLSRRLHMWEAQSQSQSWALTQSLRLQREQARGKGATGIEKDGGKGGVGKKTDGPVDEGAERRMRELEAELAREREKAAEVERAREKLGRENRKLMEVVGRYRERWEVLKAGARGRREREREGKEREGEGNGGDGADKEGGE